MAIAPFNLKAQIVGGRELYECLKQTPITIDFCRKRHGPDDLPNKSWSGSSTSRGTVLVQVARTGRICIRISPEGGAFRSSSSSSVLGIVILGLDPRIVRSQAYHIREVKVPFRDPCFRPVADRNCFIVR